MMILYETSSYGFGDPFGFSKEDLGILEFALFQEE